MKLIDFKNSGSDVAEMLFDQMVELDSVQYNVSNSEQA